jgi:transaldolase
VTAAVDRHCEVLTAYLRGLARAADRGFDLASIRSVASFFVSRLDTLTDSILDAIATPTATRLRGRLGIASARSAYRRFLELHATAQWEFLSRRGAHPQRCLWASTATKDPAYRDVMYVEELVGADTVTTLPEPTLDAFLDHGRVRPTLARFADEAERHLLDLVAAGVDVTALTRELERDGVRRFQRSQTAAVDAVATSLERLK